MKIRRSIFETNSSSSHSITICNDDNFLIETIDVNDDGVIVLNGGEFGWGFEQFDSAIDKANYCAQSFMDTQNEVAISNLVEVLIEQTGADEVLINCNGYVDHQSVNEAPTEKESIKSFIFNTKSYLRTGNDNDDAPEGWYND